MKRFIFLFTALAFFAVLMFNQRDDFDPKKPLKCTAEQMVTITQNDASTITMDSIVSFYFNDKGAATVKTQGVILAGGKKYNLNRTLSLSYSDEITGIRVRIMSQTVHTTDTTPNDIFYKNFTPEKIGDDFYLHIYKVKNNALMIRDAIHPYFLCLVN